MYWTNVAINVLLVFFVIDCVLMCLVVLMQRSKQEGLGAAFGGGFTESVWGAQTSQVLVKTTVWLAAFFFILSISLARLYAHREALTQQTSPIQQELLHPVTAPAPATPATNAAPAASTVTPTSATPAASTAPGASSSKPDHAPASAAPAKPAK